MKDFLFKVNNDIYSLESLKLSSVILDSWDFSFKEKDKEITIIVKGEDSEKGLKELLNEALNQQCRIDLEKKNSKVAKIIVTKALLSALGEENKK